ncbi:hypothetical protein FRB95_000471 [Tulasnella sp. JGI-2019a]|nr:hypothetical protein FRB95_000471 [Tulasnella sp. JGI-2019a]
MLSSLQILDVRGLQESIPSAVNLLTVLAASPGLVELRLKDLWDPQYGYPTLSQRISVDLPLLETLSIARVPQQLTRDLLVAIRTPKCTSFEISYRQGRDSDLGLLNDPALAHTTSLLGTHIQLSQLVATSEAKFVRRSSISFKRKQNWLMFESATMTRRNACRRINSSFRLGDSVSRSTDGTKHSATDGLPVLGKDLRCKQGAKEEHGLSDRPLTDFALFHEDLMSRMKALSHLTADFKTKCKVVEQRFTKKLAYATHSDLP